MKAVKEDDSELSASDADIREQLFEITGEEGVLPGEKVQVGMQISDSSLAGNEVQEASMDFTIEEDDLPVSKLDEDIDDELTPKRNRPNRRRPARRLCNLLADRCRGRAARQGPAVRVGRPERRRATVLRQGDALPPRRRKHRPEARRAVASRTEQLVQRGGVQSDSSPQQVAGCVTGPGERAQQDIG